MTEDDDKPTPPWGHDSASRRRDGDITSPVERLFEHDLGPEDRKIVERMRHHADDPYAMLYKQVKAEYLHRVEEEKSNVKTDVEMLKAIEAKRASHRKWLLGIAGTVLVFALGALGTGIGLMIARAEQEGEYRTRLQRNEQDIQHLLNKGTP